MYISLLGVIGLLSNYIYVSGGTFQPYVHLLYIPLIVAGFWLGILAGFSLALIAGLALGPFMPLVVEQNIMQTTESWVIRTFFYCLITILTGMGAYVTRAYLKDLKKRYLIDYDTKSLNYRGLENRYRNNEFAKKLTGAIAIRLRQGREVEKAFGNETLNYVMRETKSRLKELSKQEIVIARISQDTFMICLEDDRDLLDFAMSVLHHMDKRFRFNNIPFLIEIYQGITLYRPELKDAFKQMVKHAVIAADYALENRIDIHEYDHETKDTSDRNIFLMHELSQAIQEDTLTLNYQPQICFQSGDVVGVEALARWNHPELGMISPLEFTGIAEQTQLINPYTKWLLKKGMGHFKVWRDKGFKITLSLNFSMKNFEDPSVVQEIYDFLREFDLPPQAIQIEVTETAIARNIKKASDILHSLHESGIKIAIDDFGTGQSSLKYLFELPVDIIKIDQTFTKNMLENSAADAIVRSAITMGHEMNLQVVSEGVETQEQYDHLKNLGCDYGQGYFIARPMPMEMAESWLETRCEQSVKKQA